MFLWSSAMTSVPRGLIIQLYNRGLANEAIAREVGQDQDMVRSCITDYERVRSLLNQGYTLDEIGSAIGVTSQTALEYLSLAYRFNPQLR